MSIINDKIWDCMYIFSKSINTSDKDEYLSFVYFMNVLSEIYPDAKVRSDLIEFFSQEVIPDFKCKNDLLTEYVFKLNYIINMDRRLKLLDLKTVKAKYENIDKTVWSEAVWYLLHFISCNLKSSNLKSELDTFKAFLMCVRYLIPCKTCKTHMNTYIKTHVLTAPIWIWVYDYHKDVDKFSPNGKNSIKISKEQLYSEYKIQEEQTLFLDN